MERVRRRFPHTLELRFDPQGATVPLRPYAARVATATDVEVCCDFLDHVRGGAGPATTSGRCSPRPSRPAGSRARSATTRASSPGPARQRVGGRRVRVHRLEIEAFGPFADRVVVDVDALSAEGLFLIHGPTGSGKTSLLDAICFALYADVPGSRSKRGLRSDHAGPDAVPRVTLELTAGARRLRITRSPEFLRPKKRGTGTVSVQAMVTLEERRGGRWVALSTRNDEVADVVKDALGMGMAQFAKVVLLPQGDFAAFLRATPEDRREVLERLFDISAFSDVEAWLAQARRTAGADLEAARSALARGAGPRRGRARRGRLRRPTARRVRPESVGTHLRAVADRLDARVSTTMAAFDTASGAERAAAEALATARAPSTSCAPAGCGQWPGSRPSRPPAESHAQRVAPLAAAERAAGLAGHLTALDRAHRRRRPAIGGGSRRRGATLAAPLTVLADDDVAAALAAAAGPRRHRRRPGPRGRRPRRGAARQRAELDDAGRAAHRLAERAGAELAELEAERALLTAEAGARAAGAGRVAPARAAARRRTAPGSPCSMPPSATSPGPTDWRRATPTCATTALDRRSELLDLRQRRLDGMAAELARALSVGDPCPVCGALEHPSPATSSDPVLPDDIAAAEQRLSDAEGRLRTLEAEVEALRTRADTLLTGLNGTDRATLEQAVAEAAAALTTARADAAAHAEAATRLGRRARPSTCTATWSPAAPPVSRRAWPAIDELTAAEAAAAHRVEHLLAEHDGCPCGSAEPGRARAGRPGAHRPRRRRGRPDRREARLALGDRRPRGRARGGRLRRRRRGPGGPAAVRPGWPGSGPRSPRTSRRPPRPAP